MKELLQLLLDENYFSFLDHALAKEILKHVEVNNSVTALLCYLSLAVRQGHLCIEISRDHIVPQPSALWDKSTGSDESSLLTEKHLSQLEALLVEEKEKLPAHLFTLPLLDTLDPYAVQTPLCLMGNRLYFQRQWYYETFFLHHYANFIQQPPEIHFDKLAVEEKLRPLKENGRLLEEQATAILGACDSPLTVICGGPGTGKTYTAGLLINTLHSILNASEGKDISVALAAPTGKAAAHLQKSLIDSLSSESNLANVQAKTLHGLLNIKSRGQSREIPKLPYDITIVDESSMIDLRLMATLFAALKPGSRLILLGDPDQLPAVESGALFADLVAYNETQSATINLKKLNRCMRAELKAILNTATAIRTGNFTETIALLDPENKQEGLQRLHINPKHHSAMAIAKEISAKAHGYYEMQNLECLEPKQLLTHFNRFRILSPLRKGPFGVEEINRHLNERLKQSLLQNGSSSLIAPILLLKNDYRLELFNGEIGVLVQPHFNERNGKLEISAEDYALFKNKEGEIKKVPALLLPSFELAFCLSIHKSQGSEFDHLLLLLPPGSEVFGRELLYTAVTRARRQLTFWGDDLTLAATLAKKSNRFSGIPSRL